MLVFGMDWIKLYDHVTLHIVPGPRSASYFVPIILLPIALLIPRSILSRWQTATLFPPVMTACTVHAWYRMEAIDVISADVLLWSFYFLWFKDVQKDFVYVTNGETTDEGGNASGNGPGSTGNLKTPPHDVQQMGIRYPTKLSERLWWVTILLVSIRMNNWKTGEASHDRRQPPSPAFKDRMLFLKQAVLSFVRGYLILDLTRAYISYDSYFTDPTVSISSPLPFQELCFVPPRLLRSALIGAQAWAAISQFTYLPCLLPLGLNAVGFLPDEWSPHTWAPTFGSFKSVADNGIRGFWGEYWHAFMRVMTTAPGYALADFCRARCRSITRFTIIVASAYFFSGIVHCGLVPPHPLYAIESTGMIRLKVAAFFWMQAPAILAELLMGKLLLPRVLSRETRKGIIIWQVGNIILFSAWSTLCLPLLGDMGRQIGYWRVWPVPLSFWVWARGEGMFTW